MLTIGKRLAVFSIREGKGGRVWVRAGSAFVNRDGSLNVLLDVLPLDGKLHVREAGERERQRRPRRRRNRSWRRSEVPRERPRAGSRRGRAPRSWAQAAPLAPGSATTGKAKRSAGKGVLNLNTATLEQIDALPGISPQVAAAVVAERAARPFSRPEDVLEVKGVSRRRFERLRPHLTVSGATSFEPAAVGPGLSGARSRAGHPVGGTHP